MHSSGVTPSEAQARVTQGGRKTKRTGCPTTEGPGWPWMMVTCTNHARDRRPQTTEPFGTHRYSREAQSQKRKEVTANVKAAIFQQPSVCHAERCHRESLGKWVSLGHVLVTDRYSLAPLQGSHEAAHSPRSVGTKASFSYS